MNTTATNKPMRYCIIIPVYNSEQHIKAVLDDVLRFCPDVIVVNDGSTDRTLSVVERFGRVVVVSYTKNRGKGYALKRGFAHAMASGYTHAITIDADGQHNAKDIPLVVSVALANPTALVVGSRWFDNLNIPQGSLFANKFSNFWFRIQTGIALPDTQTGFRLYPLREMSSIRLVTHRYEAELELLVRSAWRNIKLIPTPIDVYYPPKEERLSHFRRGKDFVRISLLNIVLSVVALLYGYPSMLLRRLWEKLRG